MQRNGMATDVSWRRPAHHYAALYRDLLAARALDRTA
jgi:starch synthase